MVGWTIDDVVRYSKRKESRSRVKRTGRYNPKIVLAYFKECGLPEPGLEYKFHPERRWRFDFAWPDWRVSNGKESDPYGGLALEVQGGIWSMGRHNRGAAMLKEWEKLNEAAAMGWRVLYFQPSDLCLIETVETIKRCLQSENLPA